MTMRSGVSALCALLTCGMAAQAAEPLVLDLEMDRDLLALEHHIDGFLFTPTMNFSPDLAGDLARRFHTDALKNHLAATAVVWIGGEIAGFATEQEAIVTDPATGRKAAESAWLITLTRPGQSGVLAVAQREDAAPIFALAQQVMGKPEGPWKDEFQRFLSTSGNYTVSLATQDLAAYQGGRFEEYNFLNPTDLAKYGRFRAKLQFVIYPAR